MTLTLGQKLYFAYINDADSKVVVFTKSVKGVRADGKVTFDEKAESRGDGRREWLTVEQAVRRYSLTQAEAVVVLRRSIADRLDALEAKVADLKIELRIANAVVAAGASYFVKPEAK